MVLISFDIVTDDESPDSQHEFLKRLDRELSPERPVIGGLRPFKAWSQEKQVVFDPYPLPTEDAHFIFLQVIRNCFYQDLLLNFEDRSIVIVEDGLLTIDRVWHRSIEEVQEFPLCVERLHDFPVYFDSPIVKMALAGLSYNLHLVAGRDENEAKGAVSRLKIPDPLYHFINLEGNHTNQALRAASKIREIFRRSSLS